MKKKNVITERAPKMSDAIQAMIDGLKKQSRRKNFVIEMGTFGATDLSTPFCFGCAATCTLQQIAKKNLTTVNINAEKHYTLFNGPEVQDIIVDFEYAIDRLRKGNYDFLSGETYNYYCIVLLSDFYDADISKVSQLMYDNDIKLEALDNDHWTLFLPEYQRFADILRKNNC